MPKQPSRTEPFTRSYPNIAAWVSNGGWVEIGYVEHTSSFVRALDEGGMVWEGQDRYKTLEDALRAMDTGLGDWMDEQGIRR